MRLLGVIDLAGGRAVHARAGRREDYQPVRHIGPLRIASGDPIAVAAAYRDAFGIDELYVADLDAITTGHPQVDLVTALARNTSLWLDAAVTSADDARQALACGSARVVVGLETLDSFDALTAICAAAGSDRTVFSLDLHNGHPVHRIPTLPATTPAARIAMRARDAGVRTMIAIDLARVGTGGGLDLLLLRQIRDSLPEVALIAGGGIRGVDDVAQLAGLGCDGVLIATALHDGRITAADCASIREIQPRVSR